MGRLASVAGTFSGPGTRLHLEFGFITSASIAWLGWWKGVTLWPFRKSTWELGFRWARGPRWDLHGLSWKELLLAT